MIGFLALGNSLDVWTKFLVAAGSINASNPNGTLITNATLFFNIFNNTTPTNTYTFADGVTTIPVGTLLTNATNVAMPLIDSSIAHYRGSASGLGLIAGVPYLIVVDCSNYGFSAVEQYVAQTRSFTTDAQLVG